MKTLGLIGGMSWVSTADYYKRINQITNERLGGSNFARIVLYSINFDEFKMLAELHRWDDITRMLTDLARKLHMAGADCIIICANTPHLIADAVQRQINIPLIHIAEETAKEVARQNIQCAGLLGTNFVMEESFFKDRMYNLGISTVVPDDDERKFIHTSIFTELTRGFFLEETKARYLDIIAGLKEKGAEGIIYACTEIPMLIPPEACPIRSFDTTLIHATAAVNFALDNSLSE